MTMKPEDAQTYFSDYLEGGLDAAARRRFEQLLERDPQLRSEYDLFACTRDLVAGLEPEPVSPDFEDRVLARLATGLQPARPPLPWFSRGLIGAAAAAVALLAFSLSVVFQGGTLLVPDAAAASGSPASSVQVPQTNSTPIRGSLLGFPAPGIGAPIPSRPVVCSRRTRCESSDPGGRSGKSRSS